MSEITQVAEGLRTNAEDLDRMDMLPMLAIHLRNAADAIDAHLAQPAQADRVECRRCDVCDHIGLNDASVTQGACHECDWSGPEPKEDKCPGCGSKNCMAAACPECGGRYCLIAEHEIKQPSQPAQAVDVGAIREVTVELERARKDAERWRYVVNHAEWIRDEDETLMAVRFVGVKVNLESVGMRTDAIDQAMHDSAREGSNG